MLKVKAINGFSWTIAEGILSQGFLFIVGIILARILTPNDFGLIGIITALLAICNSVVEGGFGNALIRKMDAGHSDYNTVFITNLLVGLSLYLLVFVTSEQIAIFLEIPILSKILKYAGLLLIINAVSIIQRSILFKKLNFKTLAIISIISSLLSGSIAILLALNNYGVWSLVVLAILKPLINSLLLWMYGSWFPTLAFSRTSFSELFSYSYKLLVANLLNEIYRNFYKILISKYFSPVSLGFYTRAEQFQTPFSSNIAMAINRISFPILSTLQDDEKKLKITFIKFLRFSIFLNFTIMLGIVAMAEPIVLLLIGDKWSTSILYLQLLCIPGMLYPLQVLHLNLLLVKGHSDLNLKLEFIKKILLLPIILFTLSYGIIALLIGLIIFAIMEYFINSHYTKIFLDYSVKDQLKDVFPFLIISSSVSLAMYSITLLKLAPFITVILQMVIGLIMFVVINELFNLEEYREIKNKGKQILYKMKFILWRKKI